MTEEQMIAMVRAAIDRKRGHRSRHAVSLAVALMCWSLFLIIAF